MFDMLDPDKPVYVYRNLRKKCFSVRQGGRVVAHVPSITLKDCTFIVQPAGRDRVRREGRKNVHAFVKGMVTEDREWLKDPSRAVYDPYKFDTFVNGMTWKPIHSAPLVLISYVGIIYTDEVWKTRKIT